MPRTEEILRNWEQYAETYPPSQLELQNNGNSKLYPQTHTEFAEAQGTPDPPVPTAAPVLNSRCDSTVQTPIGRQSCIELALAHKRSKNNMLNRVIESLYSN